MSGNFSFLKNVDKNLYAIISDAEKLYRDEYFEQCIGQTRRFAENVCKNVLASNTPNTTFDDMLATLKDKSKGSPQEKEFIDDLYFLKQQGNMSLHSSRVKQDGIVALECLKRAFEVALNYSIYSKGQDSSLLKLHYDVELLITGKKNKSLAQRYSEKKVENINGGKKAFNIQTKESKVKVKKSTVATKKPTKVLKPKKSSNYSKKKVKNKSNFSKFLFVLFSLAIVIILVLALLGFFF